MSGPARENGQEPGDGWIDQCVEHFQHPAGAVDETPQGRLAGINRDVGLVLAEMRELLTRRVTAISRDVEAQRLQELLEHLGALHDRRERGYEELMARRMERPGG